MRNKKKYSANTHSLLKLYHDKIPNPAFGSKDEDIERVVKLWNSPYGYANRITTSEEKSYTYWAATVQLADELGLLEHNLR